MLIDIPLLKLRYEILNVSLEELATEENLPIAILQTEATKANWSQWWPEPVSEPSVSNLSSNVLPSSTTSSVDDNPSSSMGDDDLESEPVVYKDVQDLLDKEAYGISADDYDPLVDDDDESELEIGARQYVKNQALRLQVFSLAKEGYLTYKVASLEAALLTSARDTVDNGSLAPQDIKNLSAILKDISANSASSGKSMQLSEDESGLPLVIIKDLRGRK